MNSKLMITGALAVACTAFDLAAMPTESELRRTESTVQKMLKSERAALRSGKMTYSEVADAAMELADESGVEAEKLLLMKGAFGYYVKDGNLEKAAETMNALKTEFPDMPPKYVENMTKTALRGRARKDGDRLRKLLAETKARGKNYVTDVQWTYKVVDGAVVLGADGKTAIPRDTVGDLLIPSVIDGMPVNCLADCAFLGCKRLGSVTIQDGVKSIGFGAFMHCNGLKYVSIPASVTRIGGEAFQSCTNLASVSVTDGNQRYKSVNGLLLTKDGKTLLQGVNGDVTIPSGVTHIARAAFLGFAGLKSVTIPDGMEVIDWDAFKWCSNLKSVTLPSSVKKIGTCAFWRCSALETVALQSGLAEIGSGAFSECGKLSSVKIPSSVKTIGKEAFKMCGIKTAEIPSGVTKLEEGAFRECKALSSVTIPEGVTEIGSAAFWCCPALESVTIPASVKDIGMWAFSGCDAMKQINVAAGNQTYTSVDGVVYTKDGTKLIACPNAKESITILETVTSIPPESFRACGKLTSVRLPASVADIGDSPFTYCGSLMRIDVDSRNAKFASVEGVLYTKDMSALVAAPGGKASVAIPKSVTRIGCGAFKGCRALESVTIPAGVDCIPPWTFEGCGGLKSVMIMGNVKSIGAQAFWNCGELSDFSIRGERPDAGDGAFANCGKLKAIHVPANAKSWAGMKDWNGIPLVFD